MALYTAVGCVWILFCATTVLLRVEGTGHGTPTNCVSNFFEFEKNLKNNSQVQNKLHRIFNPPNQHLPYSVEVLYQTSDENGSLTAVSTESDCREEVWMWLSSPMFVFILPEHINRLSLYTLNYFASWKAERINIPVARPCPDVEEELLSQVTAQLQTYSQPDSSANTVNRGNVIHMCEDNRHSAFWIPYNSDIEKAAMGLWLSGLVSLSISGTLITIVFLNLMGDKVAKNSHTYLFEHYGILWGVMSSSILLAPAILVHLIIMTENSYRVYYIFIVLLMLPGIPIAVYFTFKYTPLAIPNIFLLPAKFVCCCNKQRGERLTSAIMLALTIIMIHAFIAHGVTVMMVMFAEPFAVIVNTLAIILILFCLINILAILFTISAYVFTPRHIRPRVNSSTILSAVVLISILITVACLGTSIALSGAVVTGELSPNKLKNILTSVALPLFLAVLTIALRKIISRLMDWSPQNTDEEEGLSNSTELHYRLCEITQS